MLRNTTELSLNPVTQSRRRLESILLVCFIETLGFNKQFRFTYNSMIANEN